MATTGDINDAFDSLLLCENQLVSEGYQAGLRIRINFIRIQHFRLNTEPDPGL
jgi:hypothetical protein